MVWSLQPCAFRLRSSVQGQGDAPGQHPMNIYRSCPRLYAGPENVNHSPPRRFIFDTMTNGPTLHAYRQGNTAEATEGQGPGDKAMSIGKSDIADNATLYAALNEDEIFLLAEFLKVDPVVLDGIYSAIHARQFRVCIGDLKMQLRNPELIVSDKVREMLALAGKSNAIPRNMLP